MADQNRLIRKSAASRSRSIREERVDSETDDDSIAIVAEIYLRNIASPLTCDIRALIFIACHSLRDAALSFSDSSSDQCGLKVRMLNFDHCYYHQVKRIKWCQKKLGTHCRPVELLKLWKFKSSYAASTESTQYTGYNDWTFNLTLLFILDSYSPRCSHTRDLHHSAINRVLLPSVR